MPCTARAGASRSRASRRVRGRTTQASPTSAPHDDGAAERQRTHTDLLDAGCTPELELPFDRIGVPEGTDRAPEEAADLPPPGPQDQACGREAEPDPRFPRRPPDAPGHGELERR